MTNFLIHLGLTIGTTVLVIGALVTIMFWPHEDDGSW